MSKQRAVATGAAPAEVPAAPPPKVASKKRWAVQLPNLPARVVEADNQAEAYEAYKKAVNIVASDHTPLIREANEAD
jgi:hypothetical protein